MATARGPALQNGHADVNKRGEQLCDDFAGGRFLIGTGQHQVFLPPATQMHFYRNGTGFEVMTTDAACRTFNVLAAEGRQVVAALLPLNRLQP